MRYSHTQTVPPNVLKGFGLAGGVGALLLPGPLKLIGSAGVAGLLYTFKSLNVTVTDTEILLKFGNWLEAKKISLSSVSECKETRMQPVAGWGIHWLGDGWLYNIYGLDAVELSLKEGGKVFIGTDEPDRLCDAIRHAVAAEVI